MNSNQRTSIDDLAAIGHELSEEHLHLAAGGKPQHQISAEASGSSQGWDVKGGYTIKF